MPKAGQRMEDKTSSVDADDEIEILEVIGLDEDAGAQPCADVDDEIVLDLDEDDEDPVATAAIDDETDELSTRRDLRDAYPRRQGAPVATRRRLRSLQATA